jgi:hypothetical protein
MKLKIFENQNFENKIMAENSREYKALNKEQINEYNREYHRAYRSEHKEQINEKFTCECGGKATRSNISKHLKTKKHLKFVETKNQSSLDVE